MKKLLAISIAEIEAVTPAWTEKLRKSITTKSDENGAVIKWNVADSGPYIFIDENWHKAGDYDNKPIPQSTVKVLNPEVKRRGDKRIPPRKFRLKTKQILQANLKKI
jgi:hypothetical protein